jgi:hypothetical protein
VRRPPLNDIPFNATASDYQVESEREFGFPYSASSNSAEQLHKFSRFDFLAAETLGAIQGFRQAVGFIEHGLRFHPSAGLKDPESWAIERLELVSLLRFDEPRVYVLDHLPRMDQLSDDDIPTRPLDDFEKDGLEKLGSAEDVIIREQGDAVRMFGSLRAASQCLDCHSVQRGELLGAFSYVLRAGRSADVDELSQVRALPSQSDRAEASNN